MSDAERFIAALKAAEIRLEAGPLLPMFTPGALLQRMTHAQSLSASIEAFWQEYLHNFIHIRSDFPQVYEAGDRAVLEWVSEGRMRDGQPIRYRGISILEFADGLVAGFRTYYDSAAFLPQGKKLFDDVGVEETAT